MFNGQQRLYSRTSPQAHHFRLVIAQAVFPIFQEDFLLIFYINMNIRAFTPVNKLGAF